jgi:hypothetical protein
MIKVSVTPQRLVVGRATQLELRLSNTSDGAHTNIVFTLGLPAGLRLVSGTERASVAAIRAGRDFAYSVTVAADRAGDFTFTSPNFSYRDEDGWSVRVSDWRATITAATAPAAPPPVAHPAPRLRVEYVPREDGGLEADTWGELEVRIGNQSDIPVADVSVAFGGPVETNGTTFRVPELRDGRAARVRVSVSPDRAGLVPVSVRLNFSYPDGLGSLRRASQEEQLNIPVSRPADAAAERSRQADRAAAAQRVRTVLFLAANPRRMAPLRPDQERRDIEHELQLDPNRDAFRLVDFAAARLTDISRALVRYKPDIVHLSGHGDAEGRLYVEDERGFGVPTNIEGMAELLGEHRATVRCVVVNACNSRRLAEAVSHRIEYAVGMSAEILDSAAITFSIGFYQAFFGGEDIPRSFALGRSLLHSSEAWQHPPEGATATEYLVPVLYPAGSE